jgi:uncharacterized SAM-binding protein YcdF (DUF218 family)
VAPEFEVLLEPVALFGWSLLLCAVLVARYCGVRELLPAALPLIIIYAVFATPLGANGLVRPLERAAQQAAAACSDPVSGSLVIVLAGGVDAGGALLDPEHLQQDSLRRVLHATNLARGTGTALILLSGGSGAPDVEADVLAEFAQKLGVSRDRLIIDRRPTNTHESAITAAQIAAQYPLRVPLLVTSAIHAPRALKEFRAAGMRPCLRPTDYRLEPPSWPGYLLPQISALDKSTAAVHEYLGLLVFFLRQQLVHR